jgi:predicted unusual protein kinase regulating ubiquinone biosynthesis (AarF/ABC1/UbiB family)
MAAAAQRACAPLAARDVEKLLRDAWKRKPAAVLEAFEPEPVACTPTAQVHRARHDGADVAVKVLRPGVAEAVRADLVLADALVRPMAAALPRIDAVAVLREVRERVLDELDLEHEASTQRAFARALRHHDALHVPAPVMGLRHERVLVSAWVDGTPVGELADAGGRERAAGLLVRFFVGAARFGTVHADPHPADALLMDDGRLAVLDFGAVRRVAAHRVDLAVRALDALRDAEGVALGAVLDELGWLPADAGAEALALARALLGDLLDGPARLDVARLVALGEESARRAPALAALAVRSGLPPEDLWPLRMLGGLVALVARLDAGVVGWPARVREAAADGW